MRILNCSAIRSVVIPEPYKRSLQLVLDKSDGDDVRDFTFLLSTLYPYDGKTDAHEHSVDELIYVASGFGYSISSGEKALIGTGTLLYASAGEKHQVVNESNETMRLVCVYVPALPAQSVRKLRE